MKGIHHEMLLAQFVHLAVSSWTHAPTTACCWGDPVPVALHVPHLLVQMPQMCRASLAML